MPIQTIVNQSVVLLTGTRDDGVTDHHKTLNGTTAVSFLAADVVSVRSVLVASETGIHALCVERRSDDSLYVPINGNDQIEAVEQLTEVWSTELRRIAEASAPNTQD